MVEALYWEDYLTIGLYFAVVIGVGLWSTFRPNRGNAKGYFLAGKDMHWIPVGASIFASNIGAPMFIGLAGTAAISGLSVTIYEWHAVYFLIGLGWIFVPVYVACGAFTMPEYLRKRFGGKRLRIYSSILAIFEYILTNISAEIYTGAIFMQQILGWNIYLCVIIILAVTAVYTSIGGLASVIYTDTLQTVILVGGASVVFVMAHMTVGSWGAFKYKFMHSAANYTLYNQTAYSCGMPREDSFHIFRDAVTGDIPWPGAVFGLSTLGIFVWCQDQIIVQRCLAARNLSHAKAGSLLAAVLKITSFALFVVPGMIARILYTDEVACARPSDCKAYCENEAGCSNIAYPLLVLRLLPSGMRGLMLAALLAALMSSLTSIFNSASSIVTLDLWKQFRKGAKETELMIVGRVTVLVLVGVSILWLPILQQSQGGVLWFYVQSIRAYLVPPWCMLFILAIFWKRTTEKGAFFGLMIGLVTGLIRMVLDFVYIAPACGSGEVDDRPAVLAKVDFLHFAIILSAVSAISIVVISLLTEPRPEYKLHRVTWWTRHDLQEPQLDSEDEGDQADDKNSSAMEIQDKEEDNTAKKKSVGKICRDWICGTSDENEKTFTPAERARIREKMTSIKEKPVWRRVVNISAIIIGTATAFLFGFFH